MNFLKLRTITLAILVLGSIGVLILQPEELREGTHAKSVINPNTNVIPSHGAGGLLERGLRAVSPDTLLQRSETVKAMDLLTSGVGWVLTERRLLWTSDAGIKWSDITPPSEKSQALEHVFFIDGTTGWALISGPDMTSEHALSLRIAITLDSGKNWSFNSLGPPDDFAEYGGVANIDFVDTLHGWVMLRLGSSSNFSRGLLFETSDGGNSWSKLPEPPLGDPVNFVTPTEGWLAGGPASDNLYVTRDAGRTWLSRSVEQPSALLQNSELAYALPSFQNAKDGVLPVWLFAATNSTLVFYVTHDAGHTWIASMTSTVDNEGGTSAIHVLGSETAIIASSGKSDLRVLEKGLQKEKIVLDIPVGARITKIDFSNRSDGWLLATIGKCETFKANCSQQSRLFSTTNAGQSLLEITPPGQAKINEPTALMPTGTGEILPYSAVGVIQNMEGFDKCAVPSVSQMSVWWNSSPYKGAGVYIGGENHSCRSQSLSSNWMASVIAMGWGIIPTWVGPQAPGVNGSCRTTCSKISTNSVTAEAQGVGEANKAADQAAAYGIQGTIIYYDMESFDPNFQSSATVVQAFLNGWVRRLRERGFKAGVYSSHPHFAGWSNLANTPDAIWFAWFFQSGVPCGNSCHTVFGVPSISDSLWFNHQRLRQTSSTIDRCWGTVCFSGSGGVDEDFLDGPVAGAGGTSCSFSVGQGTSGSKLIAFQNAFDTAGGQGVLGCATAAVRFDGFISFANTVGHYQTFANGDIEYHSNGSRAGQAYALIGAFSTKWASLGYTSNNPLGYPIGNRTAGTPSCAGTSHEFQSFEGGSLTHHLNGARSGSVYEVHGAIHSKWSLKGFASCPLGLPTSDERAASPSQVSGRTGRVGDFERGHIHWWTGAAQAYETHGSIDSLYTSMGGTTSWLGFPTSDEYLATTGYARSDFEGGYITTLNGVNYQAFPYNCNAPGTFSLISPNNGQVLNQTSVTLSWGASANANSYDVYFGTSSTPPFLANQAGTSRTVSVTSGQTYFWKVVAKVSCNSSLTSATPISSFTIQTSCAPAQMTSPANGSTFNSSTVTFNWTTGSCVTRYWIFIGSSPGAYDLFNRDMVTSTSVTTTMPTDGRTVYVTLWSWINGAWQSNAYSYIAGGCAKATMTSPANGSTFNSSTVTFNWTTGSCVTRYWIFIGSTPGAYDLFNRDMVTSTLVTTTMPTDGRTVYVTLWSWINGAWQSNAYSYIAGGCAKAAMTSPANGSTFPSSTVTFNWTTGSCVTRYWIFVGSTPGAYDLFNRDMVTSRSVTATMPTDGRTVYVTLWSWINGAWQSNAYSYTAHLLGGCSPLKAAMTSPVNGSTFPSSTVTFNWTSGSCVTRYWIFVGSTPGAYDLFNRDMVTSTSVTTTMPTDGRTVYVTLWSWINSAWQSNVYTYTAQTSGAANTPFQIRDHVNESAFGSSTVDFVRNTRAGLTQYWPLLSRIAGLS